MAVVVPFVKEGAASIFLDVVEVCRKGSGGKGEESEKSGLHLSGFEMRATDPSVLCEAKGTAPQSAGLWRRA